MPPTEILQLLNSLTNFWTCAVFPLPTAPDRIKIFLDNFFLNSSSRYSDWEMTWEMIETGFLTNPEEENYLASEKGQKEVAEGIAKAFKQYKEEIER